MKQHLLTHKVRNGDKKCDRSNASPSHTIASSSPPPSHCSSPPTSTFSPTRLEPVTQSPHSSQPQQQHIRTATPHRSPLLSPHLPSRSSASPLHNLYPPLTHQKRFGEQFIGGEIGETLFPRGEVDDGGRGDLLNLKRGRESDLLTPAKRALGKSCQINVYHNICHTTFHH